MAAYRPYRNVLRALSFLTLYGPGSFTEEAYVSFMAPYGPYKPYELGSFIEEAYVSFMAPYGPYKPYELGSFIEEAYVQLLTGVTGLTGLTGLMGSTALRALRALWPYGKAAASMGPRGRV